MADTSPDFTTGYSGEGAYGGAKLVHYERIIDCSVAANNMTSGTSHALFDLPAGLIHMATYVDPITLEGGTATIDIGVTGTDVDSLIDGADLNSATTWRSGDASTAEVLSMQGAEHGNMLLADTTFSILANNTLDAAVFRVVSVWLDMRATVADPA